MLIELIVLVTNQQGSYMVLKVLHLKTGFEGLGKSLILVQSFKFENSFEGLKSLIFWSRVLNLKTGFEDL